MKILIVDDQRTQSIGLSQMLGQLGYADLLTASSARDAYRQLDIHSLESGPIRCSIDVIMMDVNMPGISGIEACAVIKSNPVWRDIPIIMVTASADIKDLSAAFHAGAMDYIPKPLVQDELHVRVRSALRLKYETDERKKREYDLEMERERSEKLLLNVLPAPIAERLKSGERIIADQFEEVTVLFVDIANFTPLASSMSPNRLVDLLNEIFSLFDSIVESMDWKRSRPWETPIWQWAAFRFQ
jgi:adenylate cyclase